MTKLVCSVLILLLATETVEAAQTLQRIYIFQWGEYQVDGRIPNPTFTPEGIELSIDASDWRHIRTTRTIQVRKGTEACFRFWPTGVWGARAKIQFVTRFPSPGLIGHFSRQRILIWKQDAVVFVGVPDMWCVSMDYPTDIPTGEWSVELWSGRTKFAEHRFTVVPPSQARREN